MELTEAIKERRSIRRYKSDPVPHEVIQEILENAVWAPSAQNLQPWYFLALTDPSDLRELSRTTLKWLKKRSNSCRRWAALPA